VFRGNWMLKVELEIQGAVDDGTRATVVDNRFVSSNLVALRVTDGASATISGNSFTSSTQGLNVTDASAIVQANEFVSNINAMTLSNADAEVSGNTIRGGDYGVSVVSGGAPAITGNHIENAQQRGILVGGGTSPLVEGNTICGGAINLYVDPNANPKLGSNDVCPDGAAVAD
jgi:hypothetical protein